MIRRLTIVCLLVLSLAALASAQPDAPPVIPTTTPTATALPPTVTPTTLPTLAVTTDALMAVPQVEVAFPAGVRFFVRVLAPFDTLARASIRIERENGQTQTFELDLISAAVITNEYSDLTFVWQFTPQAFPLLFERLSFEWSVVVDGALATTRGEFIFTDARVLWEQWTNSAGTFTLSLPGNRGLNRLRAVMEPVFDAMLANSGSTTSVHAIVYADALLEPPCLTTDEGDLYAYTVSGTPIACADPLLAELIFQASGVTVVRVSEYRQEQMQQALTVALFDQIYRPLWLGRDVPEWYAFGLTQLYAPTPPVELLAAAQAATRSSRLFSLEQMAAPPTAPNALHDWQAQSVAMTLYLADTLGLDKTLALARTATAAGFEEAYRQASPLALSSLIPSMRDWLFTSRAEAAFSASLYASPTTTPIPSPTFTPFPATRTPRPAPTSTAFPTATLSPTRRPTATATASVTPRSLASLATQTPVAVPASDSSPLRNEPDRTTIIAVLGVILAVLVIVFARVGRR